MASLRPPKLTVFPPQFLPMENRAQEDGARTKAESACGFPSGQGPRLALGLELGQGVSLGGSGVVAGAEVVSVAWIGAPASARARIEVIFRKGCGSGWACSRGMGNGLDWNCGHGRGWDFG